MAIVFGVFFGFVVLVLGSIVGLGGIFKDVFVFLGEIIIEVLVEGVFVEG